MTTYSTYRRELTAQLQPAWGEEATAAARLLMCDHFGLELTGLLMRDMETIGDGDLEALRAKASRLAKREPLQYVTGRAEFCGHTFGVRHGVLIPRPETEELVDWVVSESVASSRMVDIGTGSGCIAISTQLASGMDVTAVDISEEALGIARENAERLGSDIRFVQCDILNGVPDGGPWDIVVSNPPYVRESEREGMTSDVLEHEPALALFVKDENPLVFYERIVRHCQKEMLRPGGSIYFEINEALGKETCALLREAGFEDIELRKDFTGRDRMVRARKPL